MTGHAIYVHWPFCISKCPYCDFNSHVRETVDEAAWAQAMGREIAWWGERFGGRATSVFFGGGTPSLMPAWLVDGILRNIDDAFGLGPDCEITLEANPSSVEAGRFRDFRAAGVNRLSLGVQSFDNGALKFLGRAHDSGQALAAIETARQSFDRFSFDLIYALPGQDAARWRAELERAIGLSAGHLSLYQLTIEANTGFAGAVRRGAWSPMDDDPAADLYEMTQEICETAGMPAYETSNHAAPGHESRHNLAYWRYGSWIGVGPGAHGRPLGANGARFATANWKKPERWLEAVGREGRGADEYRKLDADEQAEEAMLMGLRLAEGVDIAALRRETGRPLEAFVDTDAAAQLAAQGLIELDAERLRILPAGRLLLDAIASRLIAERAAA